MTDRGALAAVHDGGEGFPSNRGHIDQNLVLTAFAGLGVDTVDVAGPVAAEVLAAVPRSRMGPVEVPRPDGGMVRIWMKLSRRNGDTYLHASFSVATWHRGDNTSPGTPVEAGEAVAQFYEYAKTLVEWRVPAWQWLDVRRCDVARDFNGVTNALALIDALSRVTPIKARTHLWRDRRCTGAETLYREASDWKARLYSREALAAKPNGAARVAPDGGRVRFEVELRREHLRRYGVSTAGDLERLDLEQVAAYYWERCKFGESVPMDVADERSADRLAAIKSLPGRELNRIGTALGALRLEDLGVAHRRGSDTMRAIRATIRDYGLRELMLGVGTANVRLDLREGRAVVDA